jgi:transposase-like protein
MADTRRNVDAEFERAVRIVRESGRPIAQVARELGINDGTLGNWVVKDRQAREGGDGRLSPGERAELNQLHKENAELLIERDVLKRSVALWPGSSRPRGSSTASRIRSRVGRRGCRRPGSTSGGTAMCRCGGNAGPRWPRRSSTCSCCITTAVMGRRDLRAAGWPVSQNTVAALMAERAGRVTKAPTPVAHAVEPVGAQVPRPPLRRGFTPAERQCGDLIEIPTDEGRFYLAAALDLHSRRCGGFAMDADHDTALARTALCVAIAVRGDMFRPRAVLVVMKPVRTISLGTDSAYVRLRS